MYSEFIRQQHSIDAISRIEQVAPSFQLIKLFEQRFKNVAGVQEKTQILLNQLTTIAEKTLDRRIFYNNLKLLKILNLNSREPVFNNFSLY